MIPEEESSTLHDPSGTRIKPLERSPDGSGRSETGFDCRFRASENLYLSRSAHRRDGAQRSQSQPPLKCHFSI
jgi:hypothetical protein